MQQDGPSPRDVHCSLREMAAGLDEKVRDAEQRVAKQKEAIVEKARENYILEQHVKELDQKIELLIKAKLSVKEVLASAGSYLDKVTDSGENDLIAGKIPKNQYSRLLTVLQEEPEVLARITRLAEVDESGRLVELVIFYVFGNQYDRVQENKLLEMFRFVLQLEFREAESKGSFMRGNSTFTNMLTQYARRPQGKTFLRRCLSPMFKQLDEENESLEIKPEKVYMELINEFEQTTGETSSWNRQATEAEMLAKQDVSETISKRTKVIETYCNAVLQRIFDAADAIPYGIRWICKQLWCLAHQTWPDASEDEYYSIIGGYVFLRFIGPALVTPHALGLVDNKPRPVTQRNLVLIQKVIQNLSNGIMFGAKEQSMAVLNTFLEAKRPQIHCFFANLVDVIDLDDRLRMDRYITVAEHEKKVTLRVNDLFFVHALLVKYKARLTSIKSSLRELLEDLGPAPGQVPREENGNVTLNLSFGSSTDFVGVTSVSSAERLLEELRTHTLYFLRTVPVADSDSMNLEDYLNQLRDSAEQTNSRAEAMEIRLIHEQSEALSNSPGWPELLKSKYSSVRASDALTLIHTLLIEHVQNRDVICERLEKEEAMLGEVLQELVDQNQSLTRKLDSYRNYLANVRKESYRKKEEKHKKNKSERVRYTHAQLEEKGVITKSTMSNDVKRHLQFEFKPLSEEGSFEVCAQYRGLSVMRQIIEFEDLLERQHENKTEFEIRDAVLNVNKLIYLINKKFILNES